MLVQVTIVLDVGEQDNTEDAFDSARNQLRSMDSEETLELFDYTIAD